MVRELGHEAASDHLSHRYHEAWCTLAAHAIERGVNARDLEPRQRDERMKTRKKAPTITTTADLTWSVTTRCPACGGEVMAHFPADAESAGVATGVACDRCYRTYTITAALGNPHAATPVVSAGVRWWVVLGWAAIIAAAVLLAGCRAPWDTPLPLNSSDQRHGFYADRNANPFGVPARTTRRFIDED